MTIQLDRRPLAARVNGGGIKAPSKPFSKLLQKSRVLLQAFPKKTLAVLWDFKGLQGFQTSFDAFQIFRFGPPPFGRILPVFTMQLSRRRFHRGAAMQIERILNLTDNPILGKKYPSNSPEPSLAGSAPASGRSPWIARKLLEAPQEDTVESRRDRAILSTLLFHAPRREEAEGRRDDGPTIINELASRRPITESTGRRCLSRHCEELLRRSNPGAA